MSNFITKTGSSTLKSAQSKKCNLLKLVRNDPSQLKLALIKLKNDELLMTILSADDLRDASNGLIPSRTGRASIKIDLNDYDENGDLIKK